jgi:hypothetical protein
MSSRPRRRASKVSLNYDDNHLWEDDAVFVGEKLKIHTTRWQDPHVLEQWGIKEDFDTFANATGLLEFAQNPRGTYEELSREFLSTFRFEGPEIYKHSKKSKAPTPTFVCKFTMRGERLVMSLEEFCKAIGVENRGSWDETRADSNQELVAFWHSISVNSHDRLNRGKFTHIQHPSLRYFALFLARGFLARDNNSACTGPMVYLLKCAKENTTCGYNLGVILARSLHTAVSRNITDQTPIYAGAIATLVYEYIKDERGYGDNMGTPVIESNLLDFALTTRMDISVMHGDHYWYNYLSTNGQRVPIRLPRADLFDRSTGKWIVEEMPPQEEPQDPGMQGYQPREEPQDSGMQGYPYGYFPGGGSGYNYYPGY